MLHPASLYPQVGLDLARRHLTAFTTREELLSFKRMCSGFASASAGIQQALSKILNDPRGVQFLQDVISFQEYYPQDYDENLCRLPLAMSQRGMKLYRNEVYSIYEVSFLGHYLSVNGLALLHVG